MFIRKETRRGRVVHRVVESTRIPGKKNPVLRTVLYLGESGDLDAHLALADAKVRALCEAKKTAKALVRFAAKNRLDLRAVRDEEPDTVALFLRGGQQMRKLAAGWLAVVEESLADATARRDKLREVRRKLKKK